MISPIGYTCIKFTYYKLSSAACASGYFGNKCEFPCHSMLYGVWCMSICNCTKKDCHHIYGCSNSSVGTYNYCFFFYHALNSSTKEIPRVLTNPGN